MITYNSWGEAAHPNFSYDDALKGSKKVLEWAYEEYGEEIVYACSFGIEGIVLIDLISKVNPTAKVVFLDTDFHFKETYELIDKVKAIYPALNIVMQKPELTPGEQAVQYGEALWKSQPDLCCSIRKVEPLKKVLTGPKAWLSGLRREQSVTRANVEFLNLDHKFKMIKVCPLIHWTEDEIWAYVKAFGLPYNPLHDQGYPSIGCEYCTLPVAAGGDSRSGRWSSFNKTECGLHTR
ncbi:phosphoadenylyl-sulfate reductase [Pullulanibacillus sp. KACC 23026]|uniref:phosphoadenylyl-sulfate reductase n=1 Tax=Pullulanibacillus sp. KACC 23026 TaxID=3028315 RepID=UPI0023B119AE|nr:phosphoadenylyl-sulfate reductase [Pullulanibacillus sp. KACC 23026]WEG12989.1 phosphoadenylyl-sulfate reductase [Pullulanibacillus sp. KACC 23026]